MPLKSAGMGSHKAFLGGVLSGVVEPIGAVLTVLASGLVVPALPYLLSFAAGAMLYVVFGEIMPESYLIYRSKLPAFAVMVGLALGMFMIFF